LATLLPPAAPAEGAVDVRRIDPTTGTVQVFEVDLKAVRKGKKTDPPLQANDTISVSRRLL